MGKAQLVPITPSVLRWALHESGYDELSLSAEIEVSVDELRSWLDGSAQPSKTKFDALTTKLRRPSALFFLPQAPKSTLPEVHFRRPHGVTRRSPSPKELRYLREASRLQATMSWVSREVGVPAVSLPHLTTTTNVEAAAVKISAFLLDGTPLSRRLGRPAQIQAEWRNRALSRKPTRLRKLARCSTPTRITRKLIRTFWRLH